MIHTVAVANSRKSLRRGSLYLKKHSRRRALLLQVTFKEINTWQQNSKYRHDILIFKLTTFEI